MPPYSVVTQCPIFPDIKRQSIQGLAQHISACCSLSSMHTVFTASACAAATGTGCNPTAGSAVPSDLFHPWVRVRGPSLCEVQGRLCNTVAERLLVLCVMLPLQRGRAVCVPALACCPRGATCLLTCIHEAQFHPQPHAPHLHPVTQCQLNTGPCPPPHPPACMRHHPHPSRHARVQQTPPLATLSTGAAAVWLRCHACTQGGWQHRPGGYGCGSARRARELLVQRNFSQDHLVFLFCRTHARVAGPWVHCGCGAWLPGALGDACRHSGARAEPLLATAPRAGCQLSSLVRRYAPTPPPRSTTIITHRYTVQPQRTCGHFPCPHS